MYETPSHNKLCSNPGIRALDSHAGINDINPLQLQLSNS